MSAEATESTTVYDLLAWFETNKKRLITGAVVVGVLAFFISLAVYLKNQKEVDANAALLRLTPSVQGGEIAPADYLKVVADYPSTAAAERASLEAAVAYYGQQKYTEALDQFRKFQGAYPASRLMPQAAVGVAACLEAQGKTDEALKSYQEVANRYASESVNGQAKLAIGRLSEEKNQNDQALKCYDELLAQPNRSIWNAEASDRRQQLLRRFPNLAPQPKTAALPAAATTNVEAPKAASPAPAKTNTPAPAAAPTAPKK